MRKVIVSMIIPALIVIAVVPLRAQEKIDINSASADKLQLLDGIGPKLGAKIVAYREAYGPFSSLDDLLKVKGIEKWQLRKIKEQGIACADQP